MRRVLMKINGAIIGLSVGLFWMLTVKDVYAQLCVGTFYERSMTRWESGISNVTDVSIVEMSVNNQAIAVGAGSNSYATITNNYPQYSPGGNDSYNFSVRYTIKGKRTGNYTIRAKLRYKYGNNRTKDITFSETYRMSNSSSSSLSINWGNSPTSAQLGSTKTISFNHNTISGINISNYIWKKRYNGRTITLGSGSSKKSHAHTFRNTEAGTHVFEVTVSYSNSQCKTLTQTKFEHRVTVCPSSPVAIGHSWSAPSSPYEIQPTGATRSFTFSPQAVSGLTISSYSWTVTRPNGSTYTPSDTDNRIDVLFTTPGTYTAKVRVNYGGSCGSRYSQTYSRSVNVVCQTRGEPLTGNWALPATELEAHSGALNAFTVRYNNNTLPSGLTLEKFEWWISNFNNSAPIVGPFTNANNPKSNTYTFDLSSLGYGEYKVWVRGYASGGCIELSPSTRSTSLKLRPPCPGSPPSLAGAGRRRARSGRRPLPT